MTEQNEELKEEYKEIKWYDYTEKELIKHIYSKYSIKDFWDFWSDKESKVLEIRIQNYELIQDVSKRFNLASTSSGVYVNTVKQLKNVLALVREKATIWIGVNPRKVNFNNRGWKTFGSGKKGGSSEENILSINYLFIDIDRVKKLSPATFEELKNCDILSNKILERFETEGWANKYIKINSGNGIQLLISLDFPIKLPSIIFDNEKKIFIPNNEFETIRKILSEGIGKQIIAFSKKFKEELKCEVDNTGFRIAQVSALPFSKNFKYNNFKWRGIIEIKDGINEGLTDYIMSKEDDIKKFKSKNIFSNKTSALLNKNRLRKGKLRENILIIFMLNNKFPEGYVNNTLWFQLKILLRDSKIDLTSKEFIILHKELCKLHNRTFSLNMPEKKYIFNEDIINAYCINNQIIPVYEIWPARTKKLNMKLENLSWDIINFVNEEIKLDEETTILQDLNMCRDSLEEGSYNNITEVGKFIKGLITKYGEDKTKYYYKYLFERGLNWK